MSGLEGMVKEFEQSDTNRDEKQGKINKLFNEQNMKDLWDIMKQVKSKNHECGREEFHTKSI